MKILFLDFSTGLQNLAELESGPRRGLTNSLLHLPDALSKLNNQVYILSDIREPGVTPGNTEWLNLGSGIPGQVDVLVLNRGIGELYPQIRAKHRILWTHDLPHMGYIQDPRLVGSLSVIVFMSVYAKEVWSTFFPQIEKDAGQKQIIPNGVDKTIFYPREKDLDYLIYTSHPIRGLKRLAFIFDAIKESFPDRPLRMKCFSSWYAGEPHRDDYMDKYPDPDHEVPEGLEILPAVGVKDLGEELGRAGLMILPSGFPEICSNTILQSLASGTPIITTGGLGSAGEWIKNNWNGAMTRYQPCDYIVHIVEMCRLARNILRKPADHKRWIENAPGTPGVLTWEEVAEKWQKMFLNL
jgi:glycosyltransferase involved in cell wall biosynthesis